MADSSGVVMRKLTAADIPSALQLSAEAGWNQTADDWGTLIELAPAGCLAIELEGELAATTTLLCYGQRLAWIGMVLTRIRFRGRGFARRLMTEALELADRMHIETVKLDATDLGRPLYEKLGFRCEQAVERWSGRGKSGQPDASVAGQSAARDVWRDVDLRAFGADRSELLSKLARRNPPLSLANSYVFTRPGRVTSYLGPCVCETFAGARSLLERALQTSSGEWSWDLLPENLEAVALARALDFTPARHLIRMVRGTEQRGNEAAIYAIAGFELG
ncbi:MAG TPA: GNAT family N-acetyltransferase [Candidatus Sulfotelmatobacter sp.]|nr:GNAT family N-acetyltransferase [Candidatus Sulfotelmatobacter sp.]